MEERVIADGIRVLVVDDNMVNAMVLTTMLERYGIQADTAGSGLEAIERVCSVQYDIILMDYLMPDMDGVETTEQIMFVSDGKKRPKVIGVSATVDEEVTDLFMGAGADCVLKKPVRSEDFEMKLRQYGLVQGEDGDGDTGQDGCIDSAAFLSSVEGLDYDAGIALMAGSLDNYMKVLNVSVKNISDNYNKLDAVKNSGQMEIMAMYFHSLKGVFLNIGANSLANDSRTLESAARDFKNMFVISQTGEYMESVKKFYIQLETACGYYNQKMSSRKSSVKMEDSEFVRNLDALKESIGNFEYIEITGLLEKMIAGCDGEKEARLQDMYDFIQNFQYEEAMEILNTMY